MNATKHKTRAEFEQAAQRAHIARIRHVAKTVGDDLALRAKLLTRCSELYRQDLRKAADDFQAQQRALGQR